MSDDLVSQLREDARRCRETLDDLPHDSDSKAYWRENAERYDEAADTIERLVIERDTYKSTSKVHAQVMIEANDRALAAEAELAERSKPVDDAEVRTLLHHIERILAFYSEPLSTSGACLKAAAETIRSQAREISSLRARPTWEMGREAAAKALPEVVKTAMAAAWNEICSDTGCHPLDIDHGPGRVLTFDPRHWADATGALVAERARALEPSSSEPAPIPEWVEKVREALTDAGKLIDEMSAYVGKMALQDYKLFARAPTQIANALDALPATGEKKT